MTRKRKEHHRLPFYEEVLTRITEPRKLQELLDDAASQPEKFISEEDYEKLYWRVHAITRGEFA
jgi:hypothetical protein